MTAQISKHSKPATMRDVARLAGVSQPTVSRVLNQKDTDITISDETISKVMAAIEELGYRPNVLARSLRTQKTQMVALMLADITNSFYHPIARGVHDVAREHGYDVLIADSDHVYENEVQFFEAVTRRPVDGVIMVPIHLSVQEIDNFIMRTQTPVVVLGQHIEHPSIDVVYVDDETAIYNTTRWLIQEKQHRRIGYVGVPDELPPGPRRYRGYMKALRDCRLQPDHRIVVEGDFTMDGGRRAARELIERGNLPSALMVANDLMAIGVILTLQEAGYRVPEDVAVVGFDDIPEARIVRPTLTTIVHNSAEIGVKLAKLLFERIDNPDLPTRRVTGSYKLAERGST
jgi:DNA-binding LacI/PurR family transcriptional regulator